MKMQIEFYSKEELSIQIDFTEHKPFPENKTSEIFFFTCFALRQFHNLGHHIVTQALAGLLVHSPSARKLFQDNPELPSGESLLSYFRFHAISTISRNQGIEESLKASPALDNELSHAEATIRAFNTEILAKTPKLVNYKGRGKKSFEVTWPPFLLDLKGFGILGLDVNHHSFHSVVGLLRLLGQKHVDDKEYLDHLVAAALHSGNAYIFKKISVDQVGLADAIIKEIGIG